MTGGKVVDIHGVAPTKFIKFVSLWVSVIEIWVRVCIWSCDKLSHKSPCEARQAIDARYNQERRVFPSTMCYTILSLSSPEGTVLL